MAASENTSFIKQQNKQKVSSQQNQQHEYKKRRELLGQTYNKYDYLLKHVLPIRDDLTQKYLKFHNEYHYNILSSKIKCYQKYQHDTLQYFQCYDKVQNMVKTNYDKLHIECEVLQNKLSNCLRQCSKKSKTNEIFIECTEGPNGCFSRYRNKIYFLYNNMYKVILAEPKKQQKI